MITLMLTMIVVVMDGTPFSSCVKLAKKGCRPKRDSKHWKNAGSWQTHRKAWQSYEAQVRKEPDRLPRHNISYIQVDHSLMPLMTQAGLDTSVDMATVQFPFFCIRCGFHPIAVFFDACGKSYARLRGQVHNIHDDDEREVSQKDFWHRVKGAAIGGTSIAPLKYNDICMGKVFSIATYFLHLMFGGCCRLLRVAAKQQ